MKLIYIFSIITFSVVALIRTGPHPEDLPTQAQWWKALCKGEKLNGAMRWSAPRANKFLDPLDSPWDGTLVQELATWGYTEMSDDATNDMCDFDRLWDMKTVFQALGMDPRSTGRGGPNQCFQVLHGVYDSVTPILLQEYTVNGKQYEVNVESSQSI